MPTTLAENIAWSTGASWPVDGEPATIESIAGQVQELKDRTNFLKSDTTVGVETLHAKTVQLGLQVIQSSETFASTNISETFNGSTPTNFANSFLQPGIALLENDIVEFEYGPLVVAVTTNNANILVRYFMDSGSPTTIQSHLVTSSTTRTFPIVGRVVIPSGGGLLHVYLAGTTTDTTNATASSWEANHFIGRWRVLRPVT